MCVKNNNEEAFSTFKGWNRISNLTLDYKKATLFWLLSIIIENVKKNTSALNSSNRVYNYKLH